MSLPAPQLANILAFAKETLGLSTNTQDTRLENLIKAEFAAIEKYCERRFLVADYIERFVGAGQVNYFPCHDNIRSVASFTANNSSISPQYFNDYAVYFEHPIPRVNCTLTYSAGLDDVPEDIKRHVLDVIHHLISNPEFVVRLTEEYYLMLSFTEDNGNGIYLLFHPNCPLGGIDTLMSMAEFRL